MRKSLLILIGMVVLLLGLSIPIMQCAPAPEEEVIPPPEEEVVPPPEEEVEILYGGRLNVGWTTEQALDSLVLGPAWELGDMGCIFPQLLYDYLWMIGPAPDYEIVPRLASSWETEDYITWTFHLRKNATFHDGVPVTAEDVAFSVEYIPKAMPVWDTPDTDWESFSIIDDHTLEFTLYAPFGGAYSPVYWMPIFPKHIWEPYKDDMCAFPNDEAIGSGPFKLKEFKAAEYIWYEANEDYWGGRPYVDEVVWKTYGSEDALNMALKAGEVDMMGYYGCAPLAVDDFKQAENVEVIESSGLAMWSLVFNLHKDSPIRDLNVRKAILHGIDRDRIIDMVYLGYGEKVFGILYPEVADYNPNLPQYDYDPDLANRILDEAEYIDTDGDGIRNDPATGENLALEIIVPSGWTEIVKVVMIIKAQLRDIGIDIVVKTMDITTFYDYTYAPTEDLFDISWSETDPGPNFDWIWDYHISWEAGGEGWNAAYYNNPEYDDLLDRMRAELDAEKRRENIYELQMMLAEDVPEMPLFRVSVMDPVRTDKLEDYTLMMGGISSWINPWTYYNVHLR